MGSEMRVVVATVQVPFIDGGAQTMTAELIRVLRDSGISVEHVTRPFRFAPPQAVIRNMDEWERGDADGFDCGHIDRVICLSFPSFYLKHHHKVIWLMHQHRAVYELFGTPYGYSQVDQEAVRLKKEITQRDTAAFQTAQHVFTIARTVSARMKHYNGIDSTPLYQPPAHVDRYYCSKQLPYIFVPSRLETLKRQDLLVRAIGKTRSPVAAIIAGDGGFRPQLEQLVAKLGLESRVRFLGRVGQQEMFAWYANALGVFFGPFEEDYGFVTLEAMLSSKPVITCTDSGGPLEFVVDGETGLISEPDADDVAACIDQLWSDRAAARDMGCAGRERYQSLGISWDNVARQLLA